MAQHAAPITLPSILSDLKLLAMNPSLLPSSPKSPVPPLSNPLPLPSSPPSTALDAVQLADYFIAQSREVEERSEGVERLNQRIDEIERGALEIRSGLE